MPKKNKDSEIIKAWKKNGLKWIETIKNNLIPSRTDTTNEAILKVITEANPKTALDMGCGEGWLCRQLSVHDIKCTGIDGVRELIEYANSKGGGEFILSSYEELIEGEINVNGKFDVAIFNFSIFEKVNTIDLLKYAKTKLSKQGNIIIQTIHPKNINIQDSMISHWVSEDWKGLGPGFFPFKWYFRNERDWLELFKQIEMTKIKMVETKLSEDASPFSVIFQLNKKAE